MSDYSIIRNNFGYYLLPVYFFPEVNKILQSVKPKKWSTGFQVLPMFGIVNIHTVIIIAQNEWLWSAVYKSDFVNSSNYGSNHNFMNAHSHTQDRKPGTIFHFHCMRPQGCRPSRSSWKHFCLTLHSANYSVMFNFDFFRRFYFITSFMLVMHQQPVF